MDGAGGTVPKFVVVFVFNIKSSLIAGAGGTVPKFVVVFVFNIVKKFHS